ncbi:MULTISPECIES: hypothetical protein [unclassified Streptomyces]|uniref:hypothetical protein n=1 Tax=unclassified Streptomyces TaxID=2593676 RepID=UPI0011610F6E|nr:hypothetical protein [Streptomyces sp. TSRI0281]
MKKKIAAVGTTAAALLLVGTVSSPAGAAASAVARGCKTGGAIGGATITDWNGPQSEIKIRLQVSDTRADGHHVRVRFISKTSAGATKYWTWRKNYDGNGSVSIWNTTAEDSAGIAAVGAQAGVFEGDDQIDLCTAWTPLAG